MSAVAKRTTGYALMGAAVLLYFSRPWSCGLVLSRFTSDDPVAYSRFDYHGVGVIFAWLMAMLFAVPVLWLASKVFLNGETKLSMLGQGRETKATIVSVLIALGIGAPMHSQISYLFALPTGLAVPVLISSVAWLLIVELGRTAAVEGNLLDEGAVRVAAGLALLMAVPKLVLVGLTLSQS